MPLFKRKSESDQPAQAPAAPAPAGLPEEVVAQEYQLKLYYAGKSSEGVRIKAGPRTMSELPTMLTGLTKSDVEVVDPLELEYAQAVPQIARPSEAMQWLNAHHHLGPITRHALVVLESIDAVDLAFDTFACALLDGELDTSGYPEYNAVVGGVASHWDEATGDMIVRGVVGWGGRGVRGDTDRIDRFQHDERVARDRAQVVMRVEPLHRLGRAGDLGHRLGVLELERVDHLDVAPGEAGEHRRQLRERPRASLEAHPLAALARVIELELVLLRDDLFGHPGARRRGLGGLRGLLGL